MRKAFWLGVVACLLTVAPARAQSLTFFFNTAWLDPLAQSPLLLNLAAQSSRRVALPDVNAFDDFYLINGPGRLKVNFNSQLQNKGQVPVPGWIGVAQFSNHEIFYDLQTGFERVKANYNLPNARVGHVTVYKTIQTQQLVYDYAVQISPTLCQEYLFTPATGGFQRGFRVGCFVNLRPGVRSFAGRAGRL
jgi:hypothetical protein